MLAGVTYLVPNWVEMCLYTSVPFVLYFLYLFVMPVLITSILQLIPIYQLNQQNELDITSFTGK